MNMIRVTMPLQNIVQVMLSGIWVLSSVWRVDSIVSPWPSRNKTAFEHRYLVIVVIMRETTPPVDFPSEGNFVVDVFQSPGWWKPFVLSWVQRRSVVWRCMAHNPPPLKDPNWTQHPLGRQTQLVLRQRTSKTEKVECRITFKTDPVEGRPTDIGRLHLSPVWNLRAVIWFPFPVSSLVSLSSLVLSVRSCFCWLSILLTFPGNSQTLLGFFVWLLLSS